MVFITDREEKYIPDWISHMKKDPYIYGNQNQTDSDSDLIFSFVLGKVVGKHTFKWCNLHHSFLPSDISVIGNDYKLV